MKLIHLVLLALSHFASETTSSSDFRFTNSNNDDHKTLSLLNNQQRKVLGENDNDEFNELSSHLGRLNVFSCRSRCHGGGTDGAERWEALKKTPKKTMTETTVKGSASDASDKTQLAWMSQTHSYDHEWIGEMMSGKVFDCFCGASMTLAPLLCLCSILFYFINPSAVKVFFLSFHCFSKTLFFLNITYICLFSNCTFGFLSIVVMCYFINKN
jgi:hypothetical protein